MSATEKALIEKIKQLPPQRLAEVEDFVDFLRARGWAAPDPSRYQDGRA